MTRLSVHVLVLVLYVLTLGCFGLALYDTCVFLWALIQSFPHALGWADIGFHLSIGVETIAGMALFHMAGLTREVFL